MSRQTNLVLLWGHPRSRSTVVYRIMANRGDLITVHEPFCTLADTGSTEVPDGVGGSVACTDPEEVIDHLLALGERAPVFVKDTTEHRYDAVEQHEALLSRAYHSFIVREPAQAIASHYYIDPNVSCQGIGYENLYRLYRAVASQQTRSPPVVDADVFANAPVRILQKLCRDVGLSFDPDQLQWEPGARPEWSRTLAWHEEVARSTGVTADAHRYDTRVDNNDMLRRYYEYHLPFYTELAAARYA